MHRFSNVQLFAAAVLIWGTTWFAITFQVAGYPPELSVALRFAIAGTVVLGGCLLRGEPLRVPWPGHVRLALQGSLMFGLSYICVYHAELYVVSGLVAVGYSASPLVAGLGARWAFGTPASARFLFGGLVGLAGIALIFWPEFRPSAGSGDTGLGAAFVVAAVLLSSIGSLTASRNRLHGLRFWPAMGFAMLYGAATCALVALLSGRTALPPADAAWWTSLLYLSLAGSVLAFACFLTLQERLGPGPSGTIGVMTPLIALCVSMVFEAYRPEWLTFAGAALAVSGNVLMLRRRR
jgi:drug/metabolite transporter (DMT)-like permease